MKFLEEYDDILDQPIPHKKSQSLSLSLSTQDLPGGLSSHRKASSAISFTTTLAPSESAVYTPTASIRSAPPKRRPTITRRHTLQSGSVVPSTTRVELERQMGKDLLIPTTEISTIPCAGLRITHGALTDLMAFRFVVSLDQRMTFLAPRRSVVANFILDTGLGRSVIPPETLLALGYTGRLTREFCLLFTMRLMLMGCSGSWNGSVDDCTGRQDEMHRW